MYENAAVIALVQRISLNLISTTNFEGYILISLPWITEE